MSRQEQDEIFHITEKERVRLERLQSYEDHELAEELRKRGYPWESNPWVFAISFRGVKP